jgi:type II secretory pathway pseudopilin PulG
MTKKRLVWTMGVTAAVLAILVVAYAMLPIQASWKVNRILHHGLQAAGGAAALAAVAWALWPRHQARRRDLAREEAHRRLIAIVVMILVAVAWVAMAEVWRDRVTHRFLEPAREDLAALAKALAAYAADHQGARPDSIATLAPVYPERSRLYYIYRDGPSESAPPAEGTEPSYALVKPKIQKPGQSRPPESPFVAYLEPGNAWAALTVVSDKAGRTHVVDDDRVPRPESVE